MTMGAPVRVAATVAGFLAVWQLGVWGSGIAPFLLPSPAEVAAAWWGHRGYLLGHAGTTAAEIALGLAIGVTVGAASALVIATLASARRWLLPMLVVSQAVPVFAIAPLLVLWLGYGMASKVAMAALIIYFPVAVTFLDGLRRTEPGWIELARVMTADRHPWAVLLRVRMPAALPALASGLRVAAAAAPIGAVVGEWVGSSSGLGYAMLHANGRMQTDLMFAALATLAVLALALYFGLDQFLSRCLLWQPESSPSHAFPNPTQE